jgi:hypothetical protein
VGVCVVWLAADEIGVMCVVSVVAVPVVSPRELAVVAAADEVVVMD